MPPIGEPPASTMAFETARDAFLAASQAALDAPIWTRSGMVWALESFEIRGALYMTCRAAAGRREPVLTDAPMNLDATLVSFFRGVHQEPRARS